MGQIKINVTQEDIENGRPGQAQDCAIALAIARELHRRDRSGISVTGSGISVTGSGGIRIDGKAYKLPKKAEQFVARFDSNKAKAKPFSFMLRQELNRRQFGVNYSYTPSAIHPFDFNYFMGPEVTDSTLAKYQSIMYKF